MKLIMSMFVIVFWCAFFLMEFFNSEKIAADRCSSIVKSCIESNEEYIKARCSSIMPINKNDIYFYHTLAISVLTLSFMVSVHVIFVLLSNIVMSIIMALTTSIIMLLLIFTYIGGSIEYFLFRCVGFVIGVFVANVLIIAHIIIDHCKKREGAESASGSQDSIISDLPEMFPEHIELRNNQPGLFYDINTLTYMFTYDH